MFVFGVWEVIKNFTNLDKLAREKHWKNDRNAFWRYVTFMVIWPKCHFSQNQRIENVFKNPLEKFNPIWYETKLHVVFGSVQKKRGESKIGTRCYKAPWTYARILTSNSIRPWPEFDYNATTPSMFLRNFGVPLW